MQATAPSQPPAGTLAEQSILDAAEQLFSEKGFAAASINGIARLAAVSKANVFHHFGSKKGLYLAVLHRVCGRTTAGLSPAGGSDGRNAVQRLAYFAASHLQGLIDNPRAARLILREVTEADATEGRELAEQVLTGYSDRIVGLVAEGQREGLLRDDFEPALLAHLLVGANNFYFQTRSVMPHLTDAGFARDPDQFVRELFRLLLTGARADPVRDDVTGDGDTP